VNPIEKFRYLGPAQTARKYCLKAERAAKRVLLRPPSLPTPDTFNLRLNLLGTDFDLSKPPRWHGGWPFLYSQAIPLNAGGDVKEIWELNRHQFLPALDRELARRLVRDWIAQNPYEFGINWNSAMEVGLRLIAWIETFGRDEFPSALAQHARFVRHNLSSDWIRRGNHLIGEAAALAVYEGSPNKWLRQAVVEQFYPSGVDREQSVSYHHFVTHLLAVAGLPQSKSMAYLAAIRQPDGTLPHVGDGDDGMASTKPLENLPTLATSAAFPDAGHYVIRYDNDYCFVRCGEFGLAPNYAHGHADLLSPILWLRGQPLFVDAGTFTYNGDPQLRRHFRSAHAHNVVTVDDRDYAEQNGTFSWRNPPRGTCESWADSEFRGSHNAYRDLGITVRRRITYGSGAFTIADAVEGAGAHRLRWRFHLHPDRKIIRCTDNAFEFDGGFTMRVSAPAGIRLEVGDGWYSPSYNRRVPIQVCEILLDATLPAVATFTLQ
jgi:hypothetical protein